MLRLVLAFVVLPADLATVLSGISTVIFVGLPIYGLFRATEFDWSIKPALMSLVIGALVHILSVVVGMSIERGLGTVLLSAFQQTGILLWTLGIGVLLGVWIKDKNLMIPIAIFLIGFDMFLVFNPQAPTARFMREHPELTREIVATVPLVKQEKQQVGFVQDLAYIGPADLLFSAAFFCLLHRFGMRARRTLVVLIPILVIYLLTVVIFGHVQIGPLSLAMLPAMVPIGLTVLIVNKKEFKFARQEMAGIFIISALSVGLAGYGLYRASKAEDTPIEPLVVPLQQQDAPVAPESEGSPSPVPSN